MNGKQSDYTEFAQLIGKTMSYLRNWLKRHASINEYKIVDGVIVYLSDRLQEELIDRFYDDGKPNETWCTMSQLANKVGIHHVSVKSWFNKRPSKLTRLVRSKGLGRPWLVPPALQVDFMACYRAPRVKKLPTNSVPIKELRKKLGWNFIDDNMESLPSLVFYKGSYYVSLEDAAYLKAKYNDKTRPPVGYRKLILVAKDLKVSVSLIKEWLARNGEKALPVPDAYDGCTHLHMSPKQIDALTKEREKAWIYRCKLLFEVLPLRNDSHKRKGIPKYHAHLGVKKGMELLRELATPIGE